MSATADASGPTHKPQPRVGLFVTCLVDIIRPSVGFAAVKLLEDAGCKVVVPSQTCCGQPAYNAGDRGTAKRLARQAIDAFEDCDYVVAPSGSCGGMLIKHYPDLFAGEPELAERAERFAGKAHELISFLVDVMGVDKVEARYEGTVAYHDSCAGLRELGVKAQPRRLLAGVEGLTLVELKEAETCCGFGGLFATKYGELSNAIVARKADDIRGAKPDTVLAGDLGCLMNMAGKLQREGSPVKARHVAEILAGMADGPAIGEGKPEAGPMSVVATSARFKENAHEALTDARLQGALAFAGNFVTRRAAAVARLPEFDALRDSARAIKDHTLAHLDLYLEAYEQKVRASGGEVHYAQDADEARKIIIDLCKAMDAKSVTKGKSMIAEEIGLNDALEAAGIEPVETDLGEYIIQLRHEAPSHIIAPAIHLTAKDVEREFRKAHHGLPTDRSLAEPEQLLAEARQVLRAKFLAADVGITGANFLVAETGTSIIVTNEGNGDLTQILPEAHIVIASIEKIVPTLEDAAQLLRVLPRSATGQDASVYTTLSTGPRRPGDPDGPRAYHVVILDNGRSNMLGGEFQDMLRCIRCGACMNHCPVYQAVGGHAYGWVYPGPMGAVLTPSLIGVAEGGQLPNASTFCGRCEEVCPVRIPLPGMMRHWREREFERRLSPAPMRYGLGFWAFFAGRPALYRLATDLAARAMRLAGRGKGRFSWLPFAGGWTRYRDLAAPEGATFQSQWRARSGPVR